MADEGSTRQGPFPAAEVDVGADEVEDMLVYLEGKCGLGSYWGCRAWLGGRDDMERRRHGGVVDE